MVQIEEISTPREIVVEQNGNQFRRVWFFREKLDRGQCEWLPGYQSEGELEWRESLQGL